MLAVDRRASKQRRAGKHALSLLKGLRRPSEPAKSCFWPFAPPAQTDKRSRSGKPNQRKGQNVQSTLPPPKKTLRAKGTLISEPRFSAPLRDAIFPMRERENGLFKEKPSTKAVFPGVENWGSLISVPLALREKSACFYWERTRQWPWPRFLSKDMLHIWSWSSEFLLLKRRRMMTITKTPSRKTWYTYGHGPLIFHFHLMGQCHNRAPSGPGSGGGVRRGHWPDG